MGLESRSLPSMIYVWLVPSEEQLERPGSWRIRKWDTEPFPESNYTLSAPRSENRAQEPSEIEVNAVAVIIAESPLIDAPKLNHHAWKGLARHILEAASAIRSVT